VTKAPEEKEEQAVDKKKLPQLMILSLVAVLKELREPCSQARTPTMMVPNHPLKNSSKTIRLVSSWEPLPVFL